MSPQCLPPSFSLIQITIPEQMLFQDFQAGHHDGHFGYWNRTNLAILKLHVPQMPPTKFGLNLTYRLGADMVWRFSRWPTQGPACVLERKDFSNSESLCCSNASHQVSAQSNLQFGRRCHLKIFKKADMAAHLGYQSWMILAILNLHVAPVWLRVGKQMWFQDFQDDRAGHLG